MVLVEWSAFEVCVLEAGWLPDPEVTLAVMGVCLHWMGCGLLSLGGTIGYTDALPIGEQAPESA